MDANPAVHNDVWMVLAMLLALWGLRAYQTTKHPIAPVGSLLACNPWFQPWYLVWVVALVALMPWRRRLVWAASLFLGPMRSGNCLGLKPPDSGQRPLKRAFGSLLQRALLASEGMYARRWRERIGPKSVLPHVRTKLHPEHPGSASARPCPTASPTRTADIPVLVPAAVSDPGKHVA